MKCLVIPLLSIRVLIVTKKRPFYVKSLTNGLEEKNLELVFPWLWITVVTVWTGAENCSIARQNIIMSSSAMSRDSVQIFHNGRRRLRGIYTVGVMVWGNIAYGSRLLTSLYSRQYDSYLKCITLHWWSSTRPLAARQPTSSYFSTIYVFTVTSYTSLYKGLISIESVLLKGWFNLS